MAEIWGTGNRRERLDIGSAPTPIPVNDARLGSSDWMLVQGGRSRRLSPIDLCIDTRRVTPPPGTLTGCKRTDSTMLPILRDERP